TTCWGASPCGGIPAASPLAVRRRRSPATRVVLCETGAAMAAGCWASCHSSGYNDGWRGNQTVTSGGSTAGGGQLSASTSDGGDEMGDTGFEPVTSSV